MITKQSEYQQFLDDVLFGFQGNDKHVQLARSAEELKLNLENMIQFIEEYVTFDDQFEHDYPALEDSLQEAKQALLKAEGKV